MTDVAAMLLAYPGKLEHFDQDELVLCVQECLNCAQTCTACADACVAEPNATELARCVSVCLDCADVTLTGARILSRQTGYDANVVAALLRACDEVCRTCYDECRKHAMHHEHCRVCAEACRRCASACRKLLASIP